MFLPIGGDSIMGYYITTATDWDILTQQNKELYSKIELLNDGYKIINSLEGNLISDNLSINSDSDVRRTYNCVLQVTNSTFDIARDKIIWFDRLIRPYVGVRHQKTGEIVWYLLGTYMVSDTTVNYDTTSHQLSVNCSDLMLSLQQDITVIEGYSFTIPSGQDARTSIIGLLKDAGVSKYKVGAIKEEIPYDLEFDMNSATYDMLNTILELYDGWEMYFDIDGTFVWEMIPTCFEDDILVDNETIQNLLISESTTNALTGIYNKTIVYGDMIEPEFYGETTDYWSGIYFATIEQYVNTTTTLSGEAYNGYSNGDIVALKISATNNSPCYINLNSIGNIQVCDDGGDAIKAESLTVGSVYCFRYREKNVKDEHDFYLLGEYLPYGEYTEDDSDVEYSTVNIGQTRLQVLTFSSCVSDDLCRQRAEYETWLKCRRISTITLSMMAIYWLDVNTKISYQPIGANEPIQYIVTSVSLNSTDGTMSVTLAKFYEQYQVVYNKKYL